MQLQRLRSAMVNGVARASFALLLAAGMISQVSVGGESGFFLENLPLGSEVTLPQPATTYVPLSARVTVSATDSPQTLRIVPVNIGGGLVTDIRVAIFDSNQEQVRYVDIRPGTPLLYNFKKLSSIALVVDAAHAATLPGTLRMRVESDKPLSIRR